MAEPELAVVYSPREWANRVVRHITDHGGGRVRLRVVDRRAWAEANIAGLREVVAPLLNRVTAGRQPSSVQAATSSRSTASPRPLHAQRREGDRERSRCYAAATSSRNT